MSEECKKDCSITSRLPEQMYMYLEGLAAIENSKDELDLNIWNTSIALRSVIASVMKNDPDVNKIIAIGVKAKGKQ